MGSLATSAQLAAQGSLESSVTDPVILPRLIFLTSAKVHFKVSISSDLARGKSPKFNLISPMSSMPRDSGIRGKTLC